MSAPITTQLGADGVLLATIDMAERTMNVFSVELMDALDALMDRVEGDPAVQSCVVTSGKPSFLAGADLVMVRGYCDAARSGTHDEMFEMCGRLGRQFVRLEASAKPWVAAVNGLALGGGLELAMACRARVVADDPKIQLGLPEIRWGLLPGAGGTQRMPRLLGFTLAGDLLLTGRSLAPADAVAAGLFARAVPAAQLVAEAQALARSMHGQPYDPARKFAHLAQADVPACTDDKARDEAARAMAARHGVDRERFDRYPAYSAICDSVLQGAHLPLAEANALEMNCFLRLMFSPVAGRMVRTLFLERLRAEKELAPADGVKLEKLVVGPISEARAPWAVALSRLKLPQTSDPALPADTLVCVDTQGRQQRLGLRVLDEPAAAADLPFAVLGPAGPYGRVIELVGDAGDAGAALAARLWALPWRTGGPLSVLQQLRGLDLPAQEAVARAALAQVGDPVFLDVAACLAGVSPAYSGGPLSWQS